MRRMSWNLMLAGLVASGIVGCAQCDTCDDFPVPCTGPNCGHTHGPEAMPAPAMAYGAPTAAPVEAPQPALDPTDDVGPAPAVPAPTPPAPTPNPSA